MDSRVDSPFAYLPFANATCYCDAADSFPYRLSGCSSSNVQSNSFRLSFFCFTFFFVCVAKTFNPSIYFDECAPHRRHPMSVYQLSFSAYCIPVVVMFNLPTYILSLAQNMYKHGLASWLVRLLSNARLPYAYSSNTCTSYVQRNINQL